MYDLIVIGGGPAGLTAAVYGIRKRLNVLLISKDLGGKTNYRLALPWIEDYQVIKGLEVVNKFRSELEYLDFARLLEKAAALRWDENRFIVTTGSGKDLEARAIILATGADAVRLSVPCRARRPRTSSTKPAANMASTRSSMRRCSAARGQCRANTRRSPAAAPSSNWVCRWLIGRPVTRSSPVAISLM